MRGATWATIAAIVVIVVGGLLTIDFGGEDVAETTPAASSSQTGSLPAEGEQDQVVGEPIPDPQSSPDVQPAD